MEEEMPNLSKVRDPRFWKRWRKSGAVASTQKIVFFSTSDIFRRYDDYDGEVPITHLPDGSPIYTTGLLEQSIAAGDRIIVCSTRERLGPHDKWWLELLDEKELFLSISDDDLPEDTPYDQRRNMVVSSSWMKGMESLGIPWPSEKQVYGPTGDESPAFWASVRYYVTDRYEYIFMAHQLYDDICEDDLAIK